MGAFIEWLIARSITHRVAVVVATLVLTASGIWAFATLTTDAFPDLTPNQVIVMTTAPGLSPAEAEQELSYPMEVAMLGLPRTQGVRSISKAGLSVVTVTFDDDVDLYFARAQVQQRMLDAMSQLPPGAEPMLGPPATVMGEVFEYLVERDTPAAPNDTVALIDLTNIQEYTIKPMLRTVPGVADVNTWGGMPQQFQVNADPAKLAGYGITLQDVEMALAKNNANFGGGYIEDRGERLTLRGLGRVVDTADIGNVVVATRGATPVHVHDVAAVTITSQPRYGAVTRDGKGEALSAVIQMLKGANGREVVDRVQARLDEIRPLLPKGVRVRPFYDQGEVVTRTTHTVFRNLIEGALLVIAILFLFLRSARASLLTASVIPLSLLAAFLAMKRFGLSANLMSLGALDFGLIVDASVVMVENFVRRLNDSAAPGADRRRILQRAAFEVGRPIVFGVAIIIAVYIPIFTLEGIEGRMFRPMAFTVCAAVLGSLLLALTYVPAVASYVFTARQSRGGTDHHDARWFIRVRERYSRLVGWALTHRAYVVGGAVALLVAALASVPYLGTEFMPKLDEGYLLIESLRVPSASLGQGMIVSADVERTLERFPEVQAVVTNLGRPQEATETMALNQADVYVTFKPKSEWHARSLDELIPRMDSALAEIPGLEYDFSAPMAMRLDEVVSGVKTQLGIKIYGDSLPLLQAKADEILRVVESVKGAEDATVGVSAGAMQLEVDVDRAAIARYGLNVADVREAVETGIGGMAATQVIDGRRRYPVVVRLEAPYRSTPDAVGSTLIRTPAGGTVTLSQVARLNTVEGPEVINHENGRRYVVVQSNVRGRDLGGFVADVRRAVATRVTLPDGYYVTYGGQFENQARATKRLALIVPLVLLLIAGLLYASFGTVRHALLVMLNVPFALVGGIGALWLRGIHLNLSASVGFIALFGVAVLNGVVLIAYINQLRTEGMDLDTAVRAGTDVRLRPVLMTALVASVGFIPMAISTSSGAEVQRPLATVVIGGLVSATFLTLMVLPTVYAWLEERATRRIERRSTETPPRLAATQEV
ncbi:MAG TPA: CusA/CzcA family heavy metal efflux RND transporter [Gemmatimonadaceae bacterium]|jgi:cobalt-zinc-cadmium resistance protein CzcA|nr:CusA/CzcA family heavy metal efflux RND transporter [Gemmatimonadaceae bacterium]